MKFSDDTIELSVKFYLENHILTFFFRVNGRKMAKYFN